MSDENKSWSRFGLTELAWSGLTTGERLIQYYRARVCDHPYEYPGIPIDATHSDKTNDLLEEQMSFDPYAHTRHMDVCDHTEKCFCQMCANNIGIARGQKRIVQA